MLTVCFAASLNGVADAFERFKRSADAGSRNQLLRRNQGRSADLKQVVTVRIGIVGIGFLNRGVQSIHNVRRGCFFARCDAADVDFQGVGRIRSGFFERVRFAIQRNGLIIIIVQIVARKVDTGRICRRNQNRRSGSALMNFDGRAAGNEADGFNGGFRDADVKQVDQLLQIDFAVFSDGAFQVNADVRHICGCRRNAGGIVELKDRIAERNGFFIISINIRAFKVDGRDVFDVPIDFGQFKAPGSNARFGVGVGCRLDARQAFAGIKSNGGTADGLFYGDFGAVRGKASAAGNRCLDDVGKAFDGVGNGNNAAADIDFDQRFVRRRRIRQRIVRGKFKDVFFIAFDFHGNGRVVGRDFCKFHLGTGGIDVIRRVLRNFASAVSYQSGCTRRHLDIHAPSV